jgi:hypothetical protein
LIISVVSLYNFFWYAEGVDVVDRFVDVFQGRSPRNVLAKHYAPQGLRLLREIYDKADLKLYG